MPSTRISQRRAEFQEREKQQIERRTMAKLRQLAIKIRMDAIAAFRRGQRTGFANRALLPLHDELTKVMVISHLVGSERGKQNAELARKKAFAILGETDELVSDVYNEALRFTKARASMEDVRSLTSKYSAEARDVLKGASDVIEKKARAAVAEIIEKGMHVQEGVKHLADTLTAAGVTAQKPFLLETIVRTQVSLAYNAGREVSNKHPDIQEILWGYEYITVGDDRVREEHARLDGIRLPKDDPRWRTISPPNGYNCRCVKVEIFHGEKHATVNEKGLAGFKPDEGWDFNPGDVYGDTIAHTPSPPPSGPLRGPGQAGPPVGITQDARARIYEILMTLERMLTDRRRSFGFGKAEEDAIMIGLVQELDALVKKTMDPVVKSRVSEKCKSLIKFIKASTDSDNALKAATKLGELQWILLGSSTIDLTPDEQVTLEKLKHMQAVIDKYTAKINASSDPVKIAKWQKIINDSKKRIANYTTKYPKLATYLTPAAAAPPAPKLATTPLKVEPPFIEAVAENDVPVINYSTLKDLHQQLGSNPGGWHEAPNGDRYYVKKYKTPEQVDSDIVAAKLYQAGGLVAPEARYVDANGKTWIALKEVHGLKELHPSQGKDTAMLHVLLANRDWSHSGNSLQVNGTPASIDNGGCFEFRAQGGKKTYNADVLKDLEQFIKYDYAGMFSQWGLEEWKANMLRLYKVSDGVIDQAFAGTKIKHLAEIVKKRRDALIARCKAEIAKFKKTPVAPEELTVPSMAPPAPPSYDVKKPEVLAPASIGWTPEEQVIADKISHLNGVIAKYKDKINASNDPVKIAKWQKIIDDSIKRIANFKKKWPSVAVKLANMEDQVISVPISYDEAKRAAETVRRNDDELEKLWADRDKNKEKIRQLALEARDADLKSRQHGWPVRRTTGVEQPGDEYRFKDVESWAKGISAAERRSILEFTAGGYTQMRLADIGKDYLMSARSSSEVQRYRQMMRDMRSGIRQAPLFKGKLHRGIRLGKEDLDALLNADHITVMTCTSFSKSIDIAKEFAGNRDLSPNLPPEFNNKQSVIIEIHDEQRGADIHAANMTYHRREQEVIIDQETYKIQKIEKIGRRIHVHVYSVPFGPPKTAKVWEASQQITFSIGGVTPREDYIDYEKFGDYDLELYELTMRNHTRINVDDLREGVLYDVTPR